MENTGNQENTEQGNGERTFTQAEVNALVGKRVNEEKAKFADYDAIKEKAARLDALEEQSKSELQKAIEKSEALQAELDGLKKEKEIRGIRNKVANETGVPVILLTADTEEECREQARAIQEYSTPKGYPNVRDAGEVHKVGGTTPKQSFNEWIEQTLN